MGCGANPDDLIFETNYMKALELSEELRKPIFLNFTCFACFGEDEFMDNLIHSKEIQKALNEDFITTLLYVDDRREAVEADTINLSKIQFTENGKEILKSGNSKGRINSVIQIDIFKRGSQPTYVIINHENEIIVESFGYTARNSEYFLEKLEEGLRKYKTENSF